MIIRPSPFGWEAGEGGMRMKSDCTRIRRTILSMKKPFCIADLFVVLNLEGITDRDLILEVLDELYERGLIEYRRREGAVDDPKWAFYVAS